MYEDTRDDLERCIAQSEELIKETKETIEKTRILLADHGFGPGATVADLLMSDDCPEELRERARLDREALDRELEEEEKRLIDEYVRESRADVDQKHRGPKVPRMKI